MIESQTAIERAARAMYDAVQPEWDWNDPDAEILKQFYRTGVRAVLTAIRDPGEAIRLGEAVLGQTSHGQLSADQFVIAYRTVIDAMLQGN